MIAKQLSVFIQNEPGRLLEITEALSAANVNISAMNIAETADYGIVRMIVDDTEKAVKALKAAGVIARSTDVLRIIVPDVPGSINKMLITLAGAGINVSYMYGYSNNGEAPMVIRVSDTEKAAEVLSGVGLH
ncbi:ACT domain-containing protein [Bacilliculturomica massiliensis]|uniref:ACT domain-containing protein n=1 Tax=Bacilliculturomica massiliensis TaxID=1917867 RepID=UPI00102F72A4|nr:ACT domain-containing protein [Bacilliculturomica massiliensis]